MLECSVAWIYRPIILFTPYRRKYQARCLPPPPPSHPTSLAAAATVNSVISSSHYVLVYTVQYVWVCSVQPLIQTLSAVSTFLIYVLMYKTVKLSKLCFQQFLILVFMYTVTVCKIFTKFKLFCCAFFCFHTLTVNYTFNPLPLLSPFWLFYSHFDYYLWLSSYLPSNSLMPLLPLLSPTWLLSPLRLSYAPSDSY